MKGKRDVWILRWGDSNIFFGPNSGPQGVDLVFKAEEAKQFESLRMAQHAAQVHRSMYSGYFPEKYSVDIYDEHVGSPLIGKSFDYEA